MAVPRVAWTRRFALGDDAIANASPDWQYYVRGLDREPRVSVEAASCDLLSDRTAAARARGSQTGL